MARPRTFDEERALDAAMHIYNTFKSKHELFQRALHRYLTTMNEAQLAVLEDPARSGADRIRALFVLVLDGDAGNRPAGRSLGCLSVNTTVELAGRDAVAAGILERDTALRLAALRATVEAGRRDGSITSPRDAGDLARFLNATVAGLRVSAQGGADRAALESVAAIALDALTT
ncbi:TetR family transcriptional regulator C-terminal domain-containing protein [Streptomyces echinatus]|uniref:AcrR family transcriptional regulator n=1 Tax=Streptomyces echinatus TaxID=67293 RepID=A0A7W9PXP9_9ACTN|nr:TetR family transcriptional regulator [Streptomyces echinatus]MBB5929649.1 AcrR family transcriptional regulator [Streptomyces echinatus]